MARRLESKVALITGGARGIGRCTALLFARHGATVIIADVQDDLGQSTLDDIIHQHGRSSATYLHCDVTNEDHVRGAVDSTLESYGKLDIMFNNAAVIDPPRPSIVEAELADVARVLAVNVHGVFLGIKHAARAMIPVRRGVIVNTASIASVTGGAAPFGYTCSKHAVLGLTRNAASGLGRYGIRVNCVSPAGVATPMSTTFGGMNLRAEDVEAAVRSRAALKEAPEPLREDDVANAVLFLAGDEARHVTGHNLLVDSGTTSTLI